MRLLKLLLLLGLFVAVFLWVRSAERKVNPTFDYSSYASENACDSVGSDSITNGRNHELDLRPR